LGCAAEFWFHQQYKGSLMPVTWLHISDFHIRGGDTYESDLVLGSLIRSVREFYYNGRKPDLIFATGDIAQGGKKDEYVQATAFFDALLDAVKLERRHLFLVPGNHDVDRDKSRGLVSTLSTERESVDYFVPDKPNPHIILKLGAFRDWYNEYFDGIRIMPDDTTCCDVDVVQVNGKRIAVLPMNTALFSNYGGTGDFQKLVLGRRCLKPAMESMKALKADLNISMLHHPLEWLADFERSSVKSYLHGNIDILLRGHLHETEAEDVTSGSGELLHIAAGASFTDRQWPIRANYARFHNGHIALFPIRYEDIPEVWTVDPSVYPSEAESGYEKLFAISRLTPEKPNTVLASDIDKRYKQADEKYRNKLYQEINTISLLGSSVIQPFPLQLKDIFIPLELYDGLHSTQAMERQMVGSCADDVSSHSPAHAMKECFRKCTTLLVIGDPGSGKTTLMKFYALTCLGKNPDLSFEKLGFQEPVMVFYLPLRDLQRGEKGYAPLPSHLSAWSKFNSLDISSQIFTEWLECRASLVLLDGLDEVSDPEWRKEICRWIKDMVGLFDKAHFVVTSRPTGYRHEEGVALDFEHQRVAVRDFSLSQQVAFLNNWYGAAFMHDIRPELTSECEWQEHQQAKASELADTMVTYLQKHENKGVRELAAIPMLLQIMAILWKERKFLPGRRLELYSAALDYLLDYRDRARKMEPLVCASDARRLLAPVALWMQRELQKDEADMEELQQKMAQKLQALGQPFNAKEICTNLVDRAGVLVAYGNRYMFRHKTFREYLAACQFRDELFDSGCIPLLVVQFGEESGWWDEVIKFFIAQSNERIFDAFMKELFASPASLDFSPKQKALLTAVLEEAPEKTVDALAEALCIEKEKSSLYRQHSVLQCLKAVRQPKAVDALRLFREQGLALNQEIAEMAEDVILSLDKSAGFISLPIQAEAAVPITPANRPPSLRNPFEHDAHYILIPGGRYIYSVSKSEVRVPDLYVAKYPVTNLQYRTFIDFLDAKAPEFNARLSLKSFENALHDLGRKQQNGIPGLQDYLNEKETLAALFRSKEDANRRFNRYEQPVVGVSWYAARAYCFWISMLAGEHELYRLPTEEEWEWAAGGQRSKPQQVLKVSRYPWGEEEPTNKHANYGFHEGSTTPVGSYPDGATREGLYDMAGNVWEWMGGEYGKSTRARSLRGGSWLNSPENLRCSARSYFDPGDGDVDVGFRVVRSSHSLSF
jgi:formylglycine-generating enzyme required for sulfatase activity/predicted phosphodiesterase